MPKEIWKVKRMDDAGETEGETEVNNRKYFEEYRWTISD
jgi:hypothetical protein